MCKDLNLKILSWKYSVKKVFSKLLEKSQENTCAVNPTQLFSMNFTKSVGPLQASASVNLYNGRA